MKIIMGVPSIHPPITLCFRKTALKLPILCEGEDQDCPCEVHAGEIPQSLPRTPSSTLSLGSGSYPVLPAIEKSTTGKEPELSPGVDRGSSNGYLVQMEYQKQLRARVTYKVGVCELHLCPCSPTSISVFHPCIIVSVRLPSHLGCHTDKNKHHVSICLRCMHFKTVVKQGSRATKLTQHILNNCVSVRKMRTHYAVSPNKSDT